MPKIHAEGPITATVGAAVSSRARLHLLSLYSRNQKGERRLSPSRYKLLLAAHISVSGAWLGASAVKMVLAIAAGASTVHQVSVAYLTAISFLTSTDVTLAILTALTGVLLSLGTKWGVLQYYWIVVKIALTVTVVLTAAVFTDLFLLPMSSALTAQVATETTLFKIVSSSTVFLIALCAVDMLMIAAGAAISVYKPWGKTGLRLSWPRKGGGQGAGPVNREELL